MPASIGDKLFAKLHDMNAGNSPTSRQATNQVVALVTVSGTTPGNENITSSELSFPITYCEGCLIEYPLDAINSQTNKCIDYGSTEPQAPGCKTGQDDPIDCRSCASTNTLCENVPAN